MIYEFFFKKGKIKKNWNYMMWFTMIAYQRVNNYQLWYFAKTWLSHFLFDQLFTQIITNMNESVYLILVSDKNGDLNCSVKFAEFTTVWNDSNFCAVIYNWQSVYILISLMYRMHWDILSNTMLLLLCTVDNYVLLIFLL